MGVDTKLNVSADTKIVFLDEIILTLLLPSGLDDLQVLRLNKKQQEGSGSIYVL